MKLNSVVDHVCSQRSRSEVAKPIHIGYAPCSTADVLELIKRVIIR